MSYSQQHVYPSDPKLELGTGVHPPEELRGTMDAVLNMVKNNIMYMSKTAITGCMGKPCPEPR